MKAIEELHLTVGTAAACRALALPRASVYRQRHLASSSSTALAGSRPSPERALTIGERSEVLEVLHSERFVDTAPADVHATLLDEGKYLASVSTMYRILAANEEVRERRNQLRHPVYKKPELLATSPNQVWSWDITKLLGPAKWTHRAHRLGAQPAPSARLGSPRRSALDERARFRAGDADGL